MTRSPALVIGVDTGGTFTDFMAILPDGWLVAHKRLSTPEDPAQSVLEGLDELLEMLGIEPAAGKSGPVRLVHGSTVATNAVLERKGAKTGLLVTEGFRDLLLIGRQDRRALYDLTPAAPEPLIPRELSLEAVERTGAGGEVVVPLDEASVQRAAGAFAKAGVESVAVVFLHSYASPGHEQRAAELLRERGFFVSASHEVLPEHREYERASTTALNAYVSPVMQRYLRRLSAAAAARGLGSLRVMQSSGGVTDASAAGRWAVHTILSGPAGGVVGALQAAREAGFAYIITLDMGGTSTDVSLLPGELKVTTESEIEGYPVRVPVLDIHTVGAGGGSIAWIDAGGALRVGPRSAGARPGPACYGRGGRELTVTDANLLLGRLPAEWFLGGRMKLDVAAAWEAGRRLAGALGATVEDAAYSTLQVVASNMERAIKKISVERGFDPREFALVAFGGAGALHACELARALSIPRVLVPAHPGVLSALGMAVSDVVKTYVQGLLGPLDERRAAALQKAAAELVRRAQADLDQEGIPAADRAFHLWVDLRFGRQSFELSIPAPGLLEAEPPRLLDDLAAGFHREHVRAYGYTSPDQPIEVVAVRLRAEGRTGPRPTRPLALQQGTPRPVQALKARFAAGVLETPVFRRDQLGAGAEIPGPAVIVEPHATAVVPPGDLCRVHPLGALVIEIGGASDKRDL